MQSDLGSRIVKRDSLVNEDKIYYLDWIKGIAMHEIIVLLLLIDSILKIIFNLHIVNCKFICKLKCASLFYVL